MKAKKFLLGLVAAAMSLSIAPVAAAELEASAGVDVVSSYVWRGMYQGQGAAVQPGMGVSLGGFSASAWGSTSLDSSGGKELDFTLGYEVGGFSIAVTDYWWSGEDASYFTASSFDPSEGVFSGHYLEVALGYTISESFPLAIGVSTMICGADKKFNDKGETVQAYSTYITLDYPFAIGDVDVNANIGITPAAGMYSGTYDEAGVCSVGLTFSYDLVSTDKFSLPIFVDTSFSPIQDNAYIVAGFSFSL